MAKYSQHQIEELTRQIVSKVHDPTSVAVATEETSEGALSVSLDTMSAASAISSFVVDKVRNQTASATMAQVARRFAGINVLSNQNLRRSISI